MSNATAVKPGGHRHGRKLAHVLLDLGKRAYAVGVITLTCWLSFMALHYLIVTLMFPSQTPPVLVEIPTRLEKTILETRRSDWPGILVGENPRTPPAHYHRVDGWIQPDRFNDCTQSGCHAPLPHTKRQEVRAFLNMHATSLQCGVCHMKSTAAPLALTWYDLDEGEPCAAPAAMQAYDFVTSADGRERLSHSTPADQSKLVDLLTRASRAADGLTALEALARHVASVRPTSEAFQRLVDAVRTALPRHFRGEYGAKLAIHDPAGRPILKHPDTADAVAEYLRAGPSLKGPSRDTLLAKIHPQKREPALHCTNCHQKQDSLIAFDRLGYPAARQEALTGPPVFLMIEHISAGQPMYLPGFVRPPTSQPTTPSSPTSQAAAPSPSTSLPTMLSPPPEIRRLIQTTSQSVDDSDPMTFAEFIRQLRRQEIAAGTTTRPAEPETFRFLSAGPDGVFGTADDEAQTVVLPAQP